MKTFISTFILAFALTMGAYAEETIVTMITERAAGEAICIGIGWNGTGSITANGQGLNNNTISGIIQMDFISIPANQTIELIATGDVELEFLMCSENQLTTLDITNCSELKVLSCDDNQLTELGVTNLTILERLTCAKNQLTSLDVTNCTVLETLQCYENQLTILDVTMCPELKGLWCSSNLLTELNITNCTELITLWCRSNQFAELNVTNCKVLESLNCANNQLTEIDVTQCQELTNFDCAANQFTSLNVMQCAKLQSIDCSFNQLTHLDLSYCPMLDYLTGEYQQIEVTIASDATTFRNPIFYKNLTNMVDILINGVYYEYDVEVPITGDVETLEFTTNDFTESQYDLPFSGTITIVRSDDVSISKTATNGISIFSTTDGNFTINMPDNETYSVTIANMQGQIVKFETITSSNNTINLSNQPAGVYLFIVDNGEQKSTAKVVKN